MADIDRESARLGQRIKTLRKRKCLTQSELADELIKVTGITTISARSVQRWENEGVVPRLQKERALQEIFRQDKKLSSRFAAARDALRQAKQENATPSYEVVTLETARSRAADLEGLLEQAERLLETWELPLGEEEKYGDPSDWRDIAREAPYSHFFLLEDEKRVAGIWSLIPIEASLYEKAAKGENINRQMRVADIALLTPGEITDIYFVDLFPGKGLEPSLFFEHVRASLANLLAKWHRRDIHVGRVVANISEVRFVRWVTRQGFEFKTEHQEHKMFDHDRAPVPTQVFELDLHNNQRKGPFIESVLRQAGILDSYDAKDGR